MASDPLFDTKIRRSQDGNTLYIASGGSLVAEAGSTVDFSLASELGAANVSSTIGASTAAAGSSTSDAAGLPAGTASTYLVTGADDAKGVKIDVADQVTGRTLFIANQVANKILKIYGPTGAVINGASADAGYSTKSGGSAQVRCISGVGNTWAALG